LIQYRQANEKILVLGFRQVMVGIGGGLSDGGGLDLMMIPKLDRSLESHPQIPHLTAVM
jgi:hypothetical protein